MTIQDEREFEALNPQRGFSIHSITEGRPDPLIRIALYAAVALLCVAAAQFVPWLFAL